MIRALLGCAGGTGDDTVVAQATDPADPAAENTSDVRRQLEQTNSRFPALMNRRVATSSWASGISLHACL